MRFPVPGPELRALMRYLGFEERVRGSQRGGHAKPYQVRQVRQLILKYELGADD